MEYLCFFCLLFVNTFTIINMSAYNFCIQLGSRSVPTFCLAWSGSKQFGTLMVFMKENFEKSDFEKISRQQKAYKDAQ